jgi:hypothetical protein
MKREIERRIDALEAETDGGRIGPLIWIEPGQPVPSSIDEPVRVHRGAHFLTWCPVQEGDDVETV